MVVSGLLRVKSSNMPAVIVEKLKSGNGWDCIFHDISVCFNASSCDAHVG